MTVSDLIKKLLDFNQLADVKVVALHRTHEFSLSWGSSENCTKKDCDIVMFDIDDNSEI